VGKLPLTTSDLLAILGGLGRRPLAIVAVVLDEEDRRHSRREFHDSGIPLPGLGALDQLVDLRTIGLGRRCIGCVSFSMIALTSADGFSMWAKMPGTLSAM
jgi:hypothetical protein